MSNAVVEVQNVWKVFVKLKARFTNLSACRTALLVLSASNARFQGCYPLVLSYDALVVDHR